MNACMAGGSARQKKKKKNNCGKYPALSLWDMNLSIEREWNNNTGLCLTDGLLGKKKKYMGFQLDSVFTWIKFCRIDGTC